MLSSKGTKANRKTGACQDSPQQHCKYEQIAATVMFCHLGKWNVRSILMLLKQLHVVYRKIFRLYAKFSTMRWSWVPCLTSDGSQVSCSEWFTTTEGVDCRLRLKCNVTRVETVFRLSAKRTSPFKSAGASVQSTTGSRRVGIRVVMLDTPCSELVWNVPATHYIRQFPLHPPPMRHRVPSHFN